jgi:Fic family protein
VQKNEGLLERLIKKIHYLILKNIDNSNAGKYRNINVMITVAEHKPPSHIHLNELMASLIKDYSSWANLHPVEQATKLHSCLVWIGCPKRLTLICVNDYN